MFLTADQARMVAEQSNVPNILRLVDVEAKDGYYLLELDYELNQSDLVTLRSMGYTVSVGSGITSIDWLPD